MTTEVDASINQTTTTEAPVTAQAVVEAPVHVEAAPVVVETAPVAQAEGSLLSDALKTETTPEVKPAEAQPETKPAEVQVSEQVENTEVPKDGNESQPEDPAPLTSYELKMPDGILPDVERLKLFTDKLSELEGATKAEKALLQKFGQEFVDMHISAVQEAINLVEAARVEASKAEKLAWRESFKNDPDIGGNRQTATLDAAKELIRTHGGTLEQQKEFIKVMDETDVGSHPAVIRFLAGLNSTMKEGKPLPATLPVKEKQGKVQTMYGKSLTA